MLGASILLAMLGSSWATASDVYGRRAASLAPVGSPRASIARHAEAPRGVVAYGLVGNGKYYLALASVDMTDVDLIELPASDPFLLTDCFLADGTTLAVVQGNRVFVVDVRNPIAPHTPAARDEGTNWRFRSLPSRRPESPSCAIWSDSVGSCLGKTWISISERTAPVREGWTLSRGTRNPAARHAASIAGISWSADGRSLLYAVNAFGDSGDCRNQDIQRKAIFSELGITGGRPVTLARADMFLTGAWSPDGSLVAYAVQQDDVFVVHASGSSRRKVTNFEFPTVVYLDIHWTSAERSS